LIGLYVSTFFCGYARYACSFPGGVGTAGVEFYERKLGIEERKMERRARRVRDMLLAGLTKAHF
jgi:hypothetical protein